MGISEERAAYLVEIADARRELERLTLDVVPTEGLRVLLAAAQARSATADRPAPPAITEGRIPDDVLRDLAATLRGQGALSTSEIAQAAGYKSPSTLTRKLGVVAQPAGAAKGHEYPAYFNDQIDVDSAGRIVRAMGLAPCQVPWL